MKVVNFLNKVISNHQIKEKYGKYLPYVSRKIGISHPVSGCESETCRLSDIAEQVKSIQSQKDQLDELLHYYNTILESELESDSESLPDWALFPSGRKYYQKGVYLGTLEGMDLFGYTNIVLRKGKDTEKGLEFVLRGEISKGSPLWAIEAEKRMKEAPMLPWYEETTAVVSDHTLSVYGFPTKSDYTIGRLNADTLYLGVYEHEGVIYDLWANGSRGWGNSVFFRVHKDSVEYIKEDNSLRDWARKQFIPEILDEVQDRLRRSIKVQSQD